MEEKVVIDLDPVSFSDSASDQSSVCDDIPSPKPRTEKAPFAIVDRHVEASQIITNPKLIFEFVCNSVLEKAIESQLNPQTKGMTSTIDINIPSMIFLLSKNSSLIMFFF